MKRITCKIWNNDSDQVLVAVGIDGFRVSVEEVWRRIRVGEEFYTEANGKKANVRAGTSSTGRKYITTSPDGVIEDNLDELPKCVIKSD